MSIFSSIQLASNALQAAQIGLQVTGNNIANANTPGYLRQVPIFETGSPQRVGGLVLGSGVHVAAIKQQTDRFLEDRLRGATADLAQGETLAGAYTNLEAILGELGDANLSNSFARFFGSLADVLNQPENLAVRNLAVLAGERLANDIRGLDARARSLANELNERVADQAPKINALLEKIARLNVQIVRTEAGDLNSSDAVGLRDQRLAALTELSQLVDIRAVEQPSGSVTVFAGGDFLVFEGTARNVKAYLSPEEGIDRYQIRIAETDAPLPNSSGELNGLIAARDEVLGGFLDRLDSLARVLAFEFNKLHSSGQGLSGFSQLESEFAVSSPSAALDAAGLAFTPANGSLQVLVRNKQTGIVQTTDIFVDLNGIDQDTTLASFAAALDAIAGISATITPGNRLRLASDDAGLEFAFANDTSGLLAALGFNTFFTGDSAATIGVNAQLRLDPGKLAASSGGVGQDSQNAERLAAFFDLPLDSRNGASLAQLYERLAAETAQGSAVAKSVAEGYRVFQQSLEGQKLAISGVNIDEEAVRMIMFQRSFQAAAKYISALSDLLDTLVRL